MSKPTPITEKTQTYTALPTTEEPVCKCGYHNHEFSPQPPSLSRNWAGILVLLAAFSTILAGIAFTMAFRPHSHTHTHHVPASVPEIHASAAKGLSGAESSRLPCGTSWQEAQERGCIWDIMQVAWVPPECYDPDLSAEFTSLGPYSFYPRPADDSLNTSLKYSNYTQVSQSGTCWTTKRYHALHCIYAEKMFVRAVERGWRIPPEYKSYEHFDHCGRVLANSSVEDEAVITRVWIDFPPCVPSA